MKTTIYIDVKGRVYPSQNDDNTLTMHEVQELPTIPPRTTDDELYDGYCIYLDSLFSFGYELNPNSCCGAINDLKAELKQTDYVVHKDIDGEDVAKYKDFKESRKGIRAEINRVENLLEA